MNRKNLKGDESNQKTALIKVFQKYDDLKTITVDKRIYSD